MSESDMQDGRDSQKKDIKQVAQALAKRIEAEKPELLEGFPESRKEEITLELSEEAIKFVNERGFFLYEEHHTGPLPAPRTLKQYDSIVRDGAERIMKTFEGQSQHRKDMEITVTKRQLNQSGTGQIMGFVIALVCIAAGLYLVINNHEAAGITLFSLDIVGLVSIFVVHKKHEGRNETD